VPGGANPQNGNRTNPPIICVPSTNSPKYVKQNRKPMRVPRFHRGGAATAGGARI
jgi:hypothetical protein